MNDVNAVRRCWPSQRANADAFIAHVQNSHQRAVARLTELEEELAEAQLENEELRRQVVLLMRREMG